MDGFLNTKEAAEYLGVKVSYLRKITHLKQIPYYKYGGRINVYAVSELETYKAKRLTRVEKQVKVPYLDSFGPEYPVNLSTGSIAINEDWEVDSGGDMINRKGKGVIEKKRLKEKDWLLHYHGKGPDTFYNFFEAYCYALKRTGLKNIVIQISY